MRASPLGQSTAKRLVPGQLIVRTGGQNIGIVMSPQELRRNGNHYLQKSRTFAIYIGDDHWCHLRLKAYHAQKERTQQR